MQLRVDELGHSSPRKLKARASKSTKNPKVYPAYNDARKMVIMPPWTFLWPSTPMRPFEGALSQGHVFRPPTKNAGAKQRAKNTLRPEIRPSD